MYARPIGPGGVPLGVHGGVIAALLGPPDGVIAALFGDLVGVMPGRGGRLMPMVPVGEAGVDITGPWAGASGLGATGPMLGEGLGAGVIGLVSASASDLDVMAAGGGSLKQKGPPSGGPFH